MKKQVIIDRENFNPAIAYNLAKKVYYKNFRFKFKIAEEIKEDLIQEAAVRLYELSGKKSTDARYDDNYCRFWIAHNAMLSYFLFHSWYLLRSISDIYEGRAGYC